MPDFVYFSQWYIFTLCDFCVSEQSWKLTLFMFALVITFCLFFIFSFSKQKYIVPSDNNSVKMIQIICTNIDQITKKTKNDKQCLDSNLMRIHESINYKITNNKKLKILHKVNKYKQNKQNNQAKIPSPRPGQYAFCNVLLSHR